MKIKKVLLGISFLFNPLCIQMSLAQQPNNIILKNPQYSIYSDRVVQQKKYVAKAISATELLSDYKSPANEFLSSNISFKFSINGKDNEMNPSVDHHFNCTNASLVAPAANYPYKGFTGNGFIELSTTQNKTVSIRIDITEPGNYAIDCRYANGNGSTNTLNKCAIRTLKNDGKKIGTIVLPQRGNDEWSNLGFTNSVAIHLEKGTHTISLSYEPWNENMNEVVNQVMLDYLRVVKMD